jgi:hypothetical protein
MSISVFSVPLPPLVRVDDHVWVGWARMIRVFGLRWWRWESRALIVLRRRRRGRGGRRTEWEVRKGADRADTGRVRRWYWSPLMIHYRLI